MNYTVLYYTLYYILYYTLYYTLDVFRAAPAGAGITARLGSASGKRGRMSAALALD